MSDSIYSSNQIDKNPEILRNGIILKTLSESSPLAFFVVDNRTDKILYSNHRFCEIWGITHLEERMLRGELTNNEIIPDCLPALLDVSAFAESCKPLQSEENRITIEDEIPFIDGRIIRRFSSQMRGEDDAYFGRFYIFEDITEKKRTEEALVKAKEEAEVANKLKSMFLASMSHDIRTPLSGIIGYLDLLKSTNLSSRQLDYVNGTITASDILLYLINDILDFSKIEAGRLQLDEGDVIIRELVKEVIMIHLPEAKKKNNQISLTVLSEVPRVIIVDSNRLKQILNNMISNAVKFTENGIVCITVSYSGAINQRNLCFEVKDTGIGIIETEIENIFDPYIQSGKKAAQNTEGTGLGLAISKKLINQMGGDITVKSSRGKGASFKFFICAKTDDQGTLNIPDDGDVYIVFKSPRTDTAGTTDCCLKNIKSEGSQNSKKILLAEDNAINSVILSKILELHGFKCSVAENGHEAVVAYRREHYDMIFMDCQMPVRDGYQCTMMIRELEGPGFHIPIVAMTACAMTEDREKCLAAGMDDYLTKPISEYQVLEKIKLFLGGHEIKDGNEPNKYKLKNR